MLLFIVGCNNTAKPQEVPETAIKKSLKKGVEVEREIKAEELDKIQAKMEVEPQEIEDELQEIQEKIHEVKIDKIPILMYHMFSNDPNKWNYMIVSPEKFKADLVALNEAGYNTIHPWELIEHKKQKKDLPKNPIIISVDDGYLDNYTEAYPILKEMNMKATFLVIGNAVGTSPSTTLHYFSWEQAKEMYDSGHISIQLHSYNLHSPGNQEKGLGKGVAKHDFETEDVYELRFREDTQKLIHIIKKNIGENPLVYAYPYGIYNQTTERILKDLGIEMTLTVKEGISSINNLYEAERINVPYNLSSEDLIKKIKLLSE